MIPIVIVCYNNHIYVENTIRQITKLNKHYVPSIIIMDNCSTESDTIEFLANATVRVIRNTTNTGPWISQTNNRHVYDEMPSKFILTDPDLEFNPKMPANCVEILAQISDSHCASKVGLALDISDAHLFFTSPYVTTQTIAEFESIYWTKPIPDSTYTLYRADLDTTFCLINKIHTDHSSRHIRVAGEFTAKHLPWYRENTLLNVYENHYLNTHTSRVSTISRLIRKHIDDSYIMAKKNDKHYFIERRQTDQNLNFWADAYRLWEPELHDIMDRILHKDKIFIDIGGWIGTTCIYGSLLSKYVYTVEADPLSFKDMVTNGSLNRRNITFVERAIYDKSDADVYIGKNRFGCGERLNESTSQLYSEGDAGIEDCVTVKSLSIPDLFSRYTIDPTQVSLVKVDISGGEEHILDDLGELYLKYKIPLYVSFHIDWWRDRNLDRFSILTPEHKAYLHANPFGSILIE